MPGLDTQLPQPSASVKKVLWSVYRVANQDSAGHSSGGCGIGSCLQEFGSSVQLNQADPWSKIYHLLCEGHWSLYLVPGEGHSPGRANEQRPRGREEGRALELGKAFQKRVFGLTLKEQFSRQRRGGGWHSRKCGCTCKGLDLCSAELLRATGTVQAEQSFWLGAQGMERKASRNILQGALWQTRALGSVTR